MFPYYKKEQSFAMLPPEPISRNKSMGASERIPPIQRTPGKKALLHPPTELSGTHHSGQIKRD
jgi:hypothetical protein